MIMLGLYNAPPSQGGQLLLDCTPFLRGLSCSTDVHGFEGLQAAIDRPLSIAFQMYDASLLYVGLFNNGAMAWEGRLEDPSIAASDQGSGLSLQALGAWRALSDIPYTALWSTTQLGDFAPTQTTQVANRTPEKWTLNTNNNTLYLAPNKNENFGNLADIGEMVMQTPVGGSRTIVGFSFDVEFKAPVNWQFRVQSFNRDFSGAVTQFTLVGTGAAITRSINQTISPGQDRLSFLILNNTGGNVLKATDTGVDYARVTNIRIVTSVVNRIASNFTANRAAGVNVTATVGSTARMYVGQTLSIGNAAGTVSERVTVLSIGSSTQFNATFVNNYVIGDTVKAHVVYADEIITDMVAAVTAVNSDQLSSSTALIESPALDLTDRLYQDASMGDVVSELVTLGDGAAQLWEAGVYEDRVLFFRPQGDASQAWYVDATDLSVTRTLEQLFDSVYPVYSDANGVPQRGSAVSDSASIARYGLTRQQALQVQTTSAVTAALFAATALADSKDPLPRATVRFEAIYDANGARYPLWLVRSGDTITIRNLPPNLSGSVDRIRTFRISHTNYDGIANTLDIEPEAPPTTLEVMLARR